MRFVERAGIEAILPEMSYPMTAGVEVEGVTAVSAAQGYAEGLRLIGNRHKMDMIAHEAISKNAKASLRGVGLQAIEIGVTVGIGEENPLLVNAALGDMVCHAKGNGTRKSGHLLKSGAGGRFLSSYHISPSPKSPEVPEVPKSQPYPRPLASLGKT
jgi:hypothetical protein